MNHLAFNAGDFGYSVQTLNVLLTQVKQISERNRKQIYELRKWDFRERLR